MAYENGYNMFDYCLDSFKAYAKDKNIFQKTLQSLLYFQTRSDFPYCLEELDLVFNSLLGCNLEFLQCVLALTP